MDGRFITGCAAPASGGILRSLIRRIRNPAEIGAVRRASQCHRLFPIAWIVSPVIKNNVCGTIHWIDSEPLKNEPLKKNALRRCRGEAQMSSL
jgi:hypothetical protein